MVDTVITKQKALYLAGVWFYSALDSSSHKFDIAMMLLSIKAILFWVTKNTEYALVRFGRLIYKTKTGPVFVMGRALIKSRS